MQNKSLDITRLQQGELLYTQDTADRCKWSDDQIKAGHYVEQCMAFTNFTELNQGRSRTFIARFNSPIECKTFIDNYNGMIDKIYEQQKRINELEEQWNTFPDMF